MGFHDRLAKAWSTSGSMLCVGLDPDPAAFPDVLDGVPDAIERFCRTIVDATADLVCAFKPQFAHFASQRAEPALEAVCRYIREAYPDVVLVLDAKRGDVGSTAEHYAREAFGRYAADAVTVNPYLGTDAAAPFLAAGGVLALCHTSNPGSAEVQDLDVGGAPLFERVADDGGDAVVRARRGRPRRRRDVPGPARRGPGDRRRPARSSCPASAPRAATCRRRCRPDRSGRGTGLLLSPRARSSTPPAATTSPTPPAPSRWRRATRSTRPPERRARAISGRPASSPAASRSASRPSPGSGPALDLVERRARRTWRRRGRSGST